MIRFRCPSCQREVTAEDAHAGKKGRCPGCGQIFHIPAAAASPPPRPRAAPPAVPKRPPRRDRDEDMPMVEAAEPEEEDYDDRPRRPRPRSRRAGQWADCPNCGAPGDATRIWWTWWGGMIGPAIICHVRCNQCRTTYNGNKGDSNTGRIAIYVGVCLAIGLGIVCLGILSAGLK
jgi:predicted RNA-binding Zn-ribbon protein involved in translation (DUF1610 family)